MHKGISGLFVWHVEYEIDHVDGNCSSFGMRKAVAQSPVGMQKLFQLHVVRTNGNIWVLVSLNGGERDKFN